MRTVRLYGDLGKRFGRVFRLDVATPAEAIRALVRIRPGFKRYLNDHAMDPFRVIVGGKDTNAEGLAHPCGRGESIKIVPVVAGAKDGLFQTILGGVLIAVGIITQQPWLTSIGVSMAMGGVAQMLADSPKGAFNPSTTTSDIDTFTFNSPTRCLP